MNNKQAICIFAYNRPNYLKITLEGINRIRGVDKWDIWVCVDGGGEIEQHQKLINKYNGFIRSERFQSLNHFTFSLKMLVDKGYERIVYLYDDLLLTTDTIEYLDSIKRGNEFFYSLEYMGHPKWYLPHGNMIYSDGFEELFNYVVLRKYIGKSFIGEVYAGLVLNDTSFYDAVFLRFMTDYSKETRYAGKQYSGHFGVSGITVTNELEHQQLFNGPETQWFENAIYLLEHSDNNAIYPRGFKYR